MGCASSSFLDHEEGSSGNQACGHHIVSLTSTTYGLLTNLDAPLTTPSPPPPPPPLPPSPPIHSLPRRNLDPEVINSWELMEGLDLDSHPRPHSRSATHRKPPLCYSLDAFEYRCPPGGEDSVVCYVTTLRGIRKTFEDCNAVRAALEGLGVCVKERDVSMDVGFREELRELMKGSADGYSVPKVFVRGRYLGGAESVLMLQEEGCLSKIVEGLPRTRTGETCDGCGGARFLPCFRCCGSRKVVMEGTKGGTKGLVVRCPECNENGLVLCPLCC